MFEYWFLKDEPHHGMTHDFLEVVSQIAVHFDSGVAGNFVQNLMDKKSKELSFLRVTDWKIEMRIPVSETSFDVIKLHKHI